MQPALDRDMLDRLVARGRERGQLTTADLRANLPVEAMSIEAIALVVAHLEESGIPVEVEDSLLRKNHAPRKTRGEGAQIIPFPKAAQRRESTQRQTARSSGSPPQVVSAQAAPSQATRTPLATILLSIFVASAILTLIVLALIALASFGYDRKHLNESDEAIRTRILLVAPENGKKVHQWTYNAELRRQ